MRVMCVIDEQWYAGVGPVYGDIDEVIDEIEEWGETFYELQRFKGYAYWSLKFIPLPDAEPETVTEEETLLTTV